MLKANKNKHTKRMENNCHIHNFVQTFPYLEYCGLRLVPSIARYLTCIAVAYILFILTIMKNHACFM